MENKDISMGEGTPEVNQAAIPACPINCASQISRIVNFCCSIDIPSDLGIDPQVNTAPVLIFSPDCLNCIIDPCTVTSTICSCQVTNTVYRIRVVGNIPFLINKQITTNKCNPASAGFRLCCNKSVCVNNIVCTKCNEADAQAACAAIKERLAVCANTTVTFNPIIQDNCVNGAASFLKISGFFTLPTCPASSLEE